MNTPLCLIDSALLALALTVSPLRAQVVNDGASVTLANVTNAITGTVTVGDERQPHPPHAVLAQNSAAQPLNNRGRLVPTSSMPAAASPSPTPSTLTSRNDSSNRTCPEPKEN